MSDLLAAAAAATGVPESLLERAAAARAQASGASVDAILGAWAGGEAIAAPATAAAPEPAETPQVEADAEADADADAEPVTAASEPRPVPAIAAAAAVALDVPESVGIDEATEWPVVTTVTSAALKERTGSIVPRWLMSVFVVVPFFALGYLLVFTAGTDCGDSGQLAVDRFGQVVNCDGTTFEGKAVATAGLVDYFAVGAEVYARTGSCLGCHGANGEGGAGPALSAGAVTALFGVCEDHVTWVRLGTQAYGAQVGSTYGDTNKAVGGGGVMPGFAQLTEEELRGVVLYERVRFGGEDEAVSLVECGLDTPEGGDEDADGDSETPDEPMDGSGEGIEASAGSGS